MGRLDEGRVSREETGQSFRGNVRGLLPDATAPEPPKPESEPQSSPSLDGMMEKGREMQVQYLASLQSIFTDAWKGGSNKP